MPAKAEQVSGFNPPPLKVALFSGTYLFQASDVLLQVKHLDM